MIHMVTSPRSAGPSFNCQPPHPKRYNPCIGLIGCGGISEQHLRAYQKAGYRVIALCDINLPSAEQRRDEFFPQAEVMTDYRRLLDNKEIEVVDITTHPEDRVALIGDSLDAGKHVLSQKPFVLDLEVGERLVDLARRRKVLLAVNQNGRWAPHFMYLRQAAHAGLLGALSSADFLVSWDHNWTAGTPFDRIRHLILYDFAIHWFDIALTFFGKEQPEKVSASMRVARGQRSRPALLAHALVDFRHAQATFSFNGNTLLDTHDQTRLVGDQGVAFSQGPSLQKQQVSLATSDGTVCPRLKGAWFPDGFAGAMGELLCAIEEGREPSHSAKDNLRSLAVCFAAIASAEEGMPRIPGQVRSIEGAGKMTSRR